MDSLDLYIFMLSTAHQIELKPNNKQANYLARACGVARLAYNWGLANWQEKYQAHQQDNNLPKPNEQLLRKEFNAIKHEKYPFVLEVTKYASQQALKNLGTAFKRFFKGEASYPQFCKKGHHDSFYIGNDQFKVKDKQVWIPNLGWVKTKESYHYQGAGKINNAVISRQADRWYVSISVSLPIEQKPPRQSVEKQDCVGVDLGISHLATCSEGHKVENPKALSKNLKKLKRLSQALSRKVKGSHNRYKAKLQLSTLHQRIKNIRKDALHKLSYYLTTKFNTVVLEDLNVKGMMQNRKLSRAIADVGFYELRRQVEYKAKYYGAKVIFADRFYPSSKLCSVCGFKHEGLTLKDREWQCPHCETSHERDVNAALNLRQLGLTKIAASSTVTACGEFGSGV